MVVRVSHFVSKQSLSSDAGGGFDRSEVACGYPRPVEPLPDKALTHADGLSEGGLAPGDLDCLLDSGLVHDSILARLVGDINTQPSGTTYNDPIASLVMKEKTPLTASQKAIAARLKAAIAADQDMTEERLGEIVGVSQGQISHWTNARHPVPAKRARALAAALGFDDPGEVSEAFRALNVPASPDQGTGSQPARLDPDMLAETAKAIRLWYERRGEVYSIEDDPARFMLVYEKREKLPAVPTPDNLVEFGVELAEILSDRGEDRKHGRSKGMPTIGGARRDVGKRG